ncbi:MAG TPA: hypothetical protein VKB38_00975 [Terracidiphilus sp.]|nr:hypothetical protein [Terracidiphilus sp.]
MPISTQRAAAALAGCFAGALAAIVICAHRPEVHAAPAAAAWDEKAAARYLDAREDWWQKWDHDKRDHGTRCVSCHTQAPYALARPVLRNSLGETGFAPSETAMLSDVEWRVRAWKDALPFYSDEVYGQGKAIESRNAESVLNAVILSSYDARRDAAHEPELHEITLLAFDHAWELQSKTGPDAGAWVWQNFAYTPWESKESQYHWAALMAIAALREQGPFPHQRLSLLLTGRQPRAYLTDRKIAPHFDLLARYLKTHYEKQPLLNKVVALWLANSCPGIVTAEQRRELTETIDGLQRQDGGWSTSDLGAWQRRDGTALETRSDGYATGLIVLARSEGLADPDSVPQIARGISWLEANQDKNTGAWPAWSLNKNRDPDSPAAQFMSDAATGYAVMALENTRR